ncbi:hypothetical protein JCM15831A_00090 [Asaia astilbis]
MKLFQAFLGKNVPRMFQRKACENRIDLDKTFTTYVASVVTSDGLYRADMRKMIRHVIAEIQQFAGKLR